MSKPKMTKTPAERQDRTVSEEEDPTPLDRSFRLPDWVRSGHRDAFYRAQKRLLPIYGRGYLQVFVDSYCALPLPNEPVPLSEEGVPLPEVASSLRSATAAFLPYVAPDHLEDARILAHMIWALRIDEENEPNDQHKAGLKALVGNQTHEVDDLLRGQKSRESARRGGEAKRDQTREANERKWAQYQLAVDELHRLSPNPTYGQICDRVAMKYEVSAATIKLRTTNPRKRK